MEKSQVLPVWQPIGYSTHQIAKKVGELYEARATHTGTLDPMAEGVIVILTGKERYNKDKHTEYVKGYEFEIIFGLETDSGDAMGFIRRNRLGRNTLVFKSLTSHTPKTEDLNKISQNFIGNYEQRVPLYSAIKYKGKRLFEWAHHQNFLTNTANVRKDAGKNINNGVNKISKEINELIIKENELPTKKGEIYDLRFIKLCEVSLDEKIESVIIPNLESIVGQFRQKPIIEQWKDVLKFGLDTAPASDDKGATFTLVNSNVADSKKDLLAPRSVFIAKFYAEVSRGIYIRSLAQDICGALKMPGFVLSLIRAKNGPYQQKDCKTLEQLFGKSYDKNEFVSKRFTLHM